LLSDCYALKVGELIINNLALKLKKRVQDKKRTLLIGARRHLYLFCA
jgi:hypothetical protein